MDALNTIDVTALYANYSKQNYSNFISLLTIDAKVSVNPQLKLKMETHRMPSSIGFEMGVRYNELDFYKDGDKSGKMDILNASASLYTYRRVNKVIDMRIGLSQRYFNNNAFSNTLNNLFEDNGNGFVSTLDAHLIVDSRDDPFVTNKGLYLNSKLSVLINKGDFSNIVPIYYFKLKSVTPLQNNLFLVVDLYHRSLFNIKNQTSAYANYAANSYNSFTDYSFPIMGERGVSYLEPISSLGEIGLKIGLDNRTFIIPRFQTLVQFDKWENLGFHNVEWSAGITYQSATRFGPIDFTLGYRNKISDFNFYGGVGYQF